MGFVLDRPLEAASSRLGETEVKVKCAAPVGQKTVQRQLARSERIRSRSFSGCRLQAEGSDRMRTAFNDGTRDPDMTSSSLNSVDGGGDLLQGEP